MKRTVFISHSSQDKKIADAVCSFLEKHGVHCWIAPRDITPGKNYGAAIIDAISECEFFVLVLSSLSNDSQQVVREVERAASTQSVVIPLRIEAVQPSKDLQFYVSSSHWLDAVTPPLDQHLTELLRAIEGWQKDEGQRRRRISQPAEDIAPLTPRDTPPPEVARVRTWPGIWIAVLSAVTIAAICAVVVFLKRSPPTASPRKEISTTVATPLSATPATRVPVVTQIVAPTVVPSPTIAPRSTPASQAMPTAEASIFALTSVSPEQKADTPIIQNVTASSVLAPQTYRGEVRRYEAKLAFDHDETTAWVPTRNGINSWIEADFTSPVTITSVSIYGGYGVDAQRYERNNRARSVRVTFSDGSSETLSLEDKMKLQRFELRHPVVTSSAKIEILAVYRGDRYDETPISEIAFNRD